MIGGGGMQDAERARSFIMHNYRLEARKLSRIACMLLLTPVKFCRTISDNLVSMSLPPLDATQRRTIPQMGDPIDTTHCSTR